MWDGITYEVCYWSDATWALILLNMIKTRKPLNLRVMHFVRKTHLWPVDVQRGNNVDALKRHDFIGFCSWSRQKGFPSAVFHHMTFSHMLFKVSWGTRMQNVIKLSPSSIWFHSVSVNEYVKFYLCFEEIIINFIRNDCSNDRANYCAARWTAGYKPK